MPRSITQGANRLIRQLGALALGQAEQVLGMKMAFGVQNFTTPALILDAPFTFTPAHTNADGSATILLVGSFTVQCASADAAALGTILRGGSPFAQEASTDTGGSPNHSAGGTVTVVDTLPAGSAGAPQTYHMRVQATANITAAVNFGYLALFAWQIPSGISLAFS